jgi:hypothetical protein
LAYPLTRISSSHIFWNSAGVEMKPVYPAKFEKDRDGGYFVQFIDIPEAMPDGKNREEAELNAREALAASSDIFWTAARRFRSWAPKPINSGRSSSIPRPLSPRSHTSVLNNRKP